jgi:hypothetical protein
MHENCVKYHLSKFQAEGLTMVEVHRLMGGVTMIGGAIAFPPLRSAFEYWEELHRV